MMNRKEYEDSIYRENIKDIINDIYYSNASYTTKISRSRTLAEYIIRRLIKQSPNSELALGDDRTRNELKKAGVTEKFFWNAYNAVRKACNKATNSKNYNQLTVADFSEVNTAVITLYAYLFFDYFKKYKFGSNLDIVTAFSFLPPDMRFIVLRELVFNNYDCDVYTISKFCLSLIKSMGAEKARRWVIENRGRLSSISMPYGSEDINKKIEEYGIDNIRMVMDEIQETVYDYLIREIQKPELCFLNPENLPYHSFEEAKIYYEEHGVVSGNSEDVRQFNALMQYVYTGRQDEK